MPAAACRAAHGLGGLQLWSSRSDRLRRDPSVRLRSPPRGHHRCDRQNRSASRSVATGRWATGLPRTPVARRAPDAGRGCGRSWMATATGTNGCPCVTRRRIRCFSPISATSPASTRRGCPTSLAWTLRLTYRPTWSGERWAFYLDLINLLNAKNVVRSIRRSSSILVDRPAIIERAQDRGIPFFPSFGVRFWF